MSKLSLTHRYKYKLKAYRILQAERAEFHDLFFHHDYHVLLPGPTGPVAEDAPTGLQVLATCLRFAADNPKKSILIAGHTDTSGPDDYNVKLSWKRADNVHFLLSGDKEKWVDASKHKGGKHFDWHHILKWLSTEGWACDPGPHECDPDRATPINPDNAPVKNAVKAFQAEYNRRFEQSIDEDGIVGKQTWGAFFDVYVDVLGAMLDPKANTVASRVSAVDKAKGKLSYLEGGKECVGCGESFPREAVGVDGLRSQTNRRVELLFFNDDEKNKITLDCHPGRDQCDKDKCLIYKSGTVRIVPIPIKPVKPLPVSRVRITALDKWFIPDAESCDIEFSLEGDKECANQVDFEVYGSNYCELEAWNAGLPTFRAKDGVPVYKSTLPEGKAAAGSTQTISDWKGQANCQEGLLAPGQPANIRHLNVAFSPYTVLLRYLKKDTATDADKSARLEVAPFWPQFGADGKITAASGAIKWKVVGTDKLKAGALQIVDTEGSVVFSKELGADDLSKDSEKEFVWDGKYKEGAAEASAEHMPYRIQVLAHTGLNEAEALALAAMHTEVRLYVHRDTHAPDLDPYIASTDQKSLDFTIADLYHKDTAPVRASDGKLWTKFALAQAGFHPGPVNDGNTNPAFQTALNEFQRSVPKHPPRAENHFERLTITGGGNDDNDTRDALEHLAHPRRRPWFGRSDTRADFADILDADGNVTTEFKDAPAFKTALNNSAETMILWVDDRHWYSDCAWIGASDDVTPKIRQTITRHPSDLGNNRGGYTAGDTRVQYDARDIARPWIPLQVDFRVLGKANNLQDEVAPPASEGIATAMRRAIGPLRVDWTFDEIEGTSPVNVTVGGTASTLDLPVLEPVIENTLSHLYHRDRHRTRIALRWALDQLKGEHTRTDVKKNAKYYNCPEACGGIRPTNLAQYYRAVFGVDGESLLPWTAKADSTRQAIVTVVHDKLGQPEADFAPKRSGRAGVYFHPSRIAGDGYQVRAQVRFEESSDYKFPNLEALKGRYTRLPQAHSSKFRLWRKTSIRGYVSWGPTNTWAAAPAAPRANVPVKGPDGFRQYYTACYVHVGNELGTTNANLDLSPNVLFPDARAFRNMVKECVRPRDPRRTDAWIAVSNRFWPWDTHNQFGVPEASRPNLSAWDGFTDLNERIIEPHWWKYAIRVSSEIVRQVEKLRGRLRGHVIVEYQTTNDVYYRQYDCGRCGDRFTYIQDNDGGLKSGARCPTRACGRRAIRPGRLRTLPRYRGHYECANGHGWAARENNAAGGRIAGTPCPTCGTNRTMSQVQRELYRCSVCRFEALYPEPGAPGARGSHENEACPCTPCTGQMRSRNQALTAGNHVDIQPSAPAARAQFSSGGVPTPGLPSSSLGNPVGVSLNFLGDTDLWAHELGHNRYFEHTGNAGTSSGSSHDQHDHRTNSTVNWTDPAINETDANNRMWDRACMMTYATDLATYDANRDMPCFCYKCVLKNRGWELNDGSTPVPLPAGDLQDPP